jgi:hypothetical protein
MTTTDALARRLHAAVIAAPYRDWRKMYAGRKTATGVTLDGADTGKVWVRAEEDSREETQVWGSITRINLPVWVGPNITGELEVKAVEQVEAALTAGAYAAGSLIPPQTPENNDSLLIGGRQFKPGRMRMSDLGGLYVYVEPFHDDGFWWPGGDIELTPTATADSQAWVAVALNPADGTLYEFAGVDNSMPVVMTENDLSAIAITAGYIPVGAVVLYEGQTAITGTETWADFHYHYAAARGKATVQTTNNTATTLASVAVAEDQAVTVTVTVTGAIADYSAAIGGTLMIVARRAAGGNVTAVGSVTADVEEDSASSPTFTADVDTGTQTVRVRVTGVTAETWNWKCTYDVLRETT